MSREKNFDSLFSGRSPRADIKPASDTELADLSKALAEVDWYNAADRRAIADTVVRKLNEEIRQEDISQFFATVDTFGVNETPEYQYQKGLKAYIREPGTYMPRSTITQRTVTLDTEKVGVHPEFELSQLQAGRYGSLANVKNMAREALVGKRNAILWNTLVNSITGTPATGTNYLAFSSTAAAAIKKNFLVSGIDYADDKAVNGIQAIVGRRSLLGFIMDLDGYSDKFQEIRDLGGNSLTGGVMMGAFRGIPIVALHQYTDGYDQNVISATDIMIVSRGTTRLAVTQPVQALEEIDVDYAIWHMHLFEKYGAGIFWPDRNVRIAVS